MYTLEKAPNTNIFKSHTCSLYCLSLPPFLLLHINSTTASINSTGLGTKVMFAMEKKKCIFSSQMPPTSWVKNSEVFLNLLLHCRGRSCVSSNSCPEQLEADICTKYFFWDKQIKYNKAQKGGKERVMHKLQFFRLNQGLTEYTARLWIHLQTV